MSEKDAALGDIAMLERYITELRAANVAAWKLLGRCELAFELISTARSVVTARQTAKQLQAEIKRAAAGKEST
jgi:hypothetical protein